MLCDLARRLGSMQREIPHLDAGIRLGCSGAEIWEFLIKEREMNRSVLLSSFIAGVVACAFSVNAGFSRGPEVSGAGIWGGVVMSALAQRVYAKVHQTAARALIFRLPRGATVTAKVVLP